MERSVPATQPTINIRQLHNRFYEKRTIGTGEGMLAFLKNPSTVVTKIKDEGTTEDYVDNMINLYKN